MENKSTKLDTGTTAQTDANTVLVAVRKRGGDNGKRKCLMGEYGEKITIEGLCLLPFSNTDKSY